MPLLFKKIFRWRFVQNLKEPIWHLSKVQSKLLEMFDKSRLIMVQTNKIKMQINKMLGDVDFLIE